MSTEINAYDLLFVLTAIAFNLLIVGIFITQKNRWAKPLKVLGILWLLLSVPFAVVFVRYLTEGKGPEIIVPFGAVLLYMLVEFLLDYVIKVDFRRKWITHIPYIILEYIALFSLIGIAFDIDQAWGYLVAIAFWVLMVSLIYVYWDNINVWKKAGK